MELPTALHRVKEAVKRVFEGPSNPNVRRSLTYLGLVLINIPNGVMWYAGNLTTYTNSYFIGKFGPDAQTGSVMLTVSFISARSLGLVLFSKVIGRIGKRWAMQIGILVFTASISTCYFAVQYSATALILLLGIMSGLCAGNFRSLAYMYVVIWTTGKDVGFVSGLTTQTCLGAIVINQLITMYINPDNVAPDLEAHESKYFTQPELLHRVPSLFLVLGCAAFVAQQLGFIMLMEPKRTGSDWEIDNDDGTMRLLQDNGKSSYGKISIDNKTGPERLSSKLSISDKSISIESAATSEGCSSKSDLQSCLPESGLKTYSSVEDQSNTANKKANGDDSTCISLQHADPPDYNSQREDINCDNEKDSSGEKTDDDLKPTEVLRHKIFYVLWTMYGLCELTLAITATVYKTFGQIKISDDHFLADLGTAITVCLVGARIGWGIFCDKVGYKMSLICEFSTGALSVLFMFFTVHNKWLYFIGVCATIFFFNGMYSNLTVAVYKLFGKSHFSVNIAMLSSSTAVAGVLSLFLYNSILDCCGWFWVFCALGIVQILGLLTTIVVVPRD